MKNKVLFAACGRSGNPPAQPAQPMMEVLSAEDGILANPPLAGGSDGAAFKPATMEAFSTPGNGTLTIVKEESPASFEVEHTLQTMNGARTVTFDSKTGHLFTMSQEWGPAPPPPGGGRGRPRRTRFVYLSDDRQVRAAIFEQQRRLPLTGTCWNLLFRSRAPQYPLRPCFSNRRLVPDPF